MNNIDKDVFNKGSNMTEQALRYNTGKAELSYILDAMPALKDMVAVMESGAGKYSRNNWMRGFPREKLLDSLLRHVDAFYSGEDLDPESGLPHVGHILCNAMFLGYHNGSESKYWKDKYPEEVAKEESSINIPEGHIDLTDSPKDVFRDYKVGDEVTICFPKGIKSDYSYDKVTGEESECDATALLLNNNMINTDGVKGEIEAITPRGFRVEFPEHPSWNYLPHWLKPSIPKTIPEFKVGDRVKIVIPESLEVGTRDHRSRAYESDPYSGVSYVKEMQECNGMVGEIMRFCPYIGYSVNVIESQTPDIYYTYLPEWLEKVED